jgi:cellulose synthase/poly-beta-1,6-N-acetylglucosamine synthase-like glycosyltransferase
MPKVAIVVIGRNEAASLASCLSSVDEHRGYIVYADSASTDASPEIAREHEAHVVSVDPARPLTPARGRNEGFAALLELFPDCEFVQFIDGDSRVSPGWIESAAAFLNANEHVGVVCGHLVEEHPGKSVYNWLCSNEWEGAVGQVDACGGNAMIRVSALREVGGFRGDLVAGEEAELMARMRSRGWEIWRIDRPMVVHDADIRRFSEWWGRARRGGYSYANVWWLTKSSRERLYAQQLRSSLFWIVGLPGAAVALSLVFWQPLLLLLLPLAWAVQIARIALRQSSSNHRPWTYGALIMLAKIPEAAGILHYFSKQALRRS